MLLRKPRSSERGGCQKFVGIHKMVYIDFTYPPQSFTFDNNSYTVPIKRFPTVIYSPLSTKANFNIQGSTSSINKGTSSDSTLIIKDRNPTVNENLPIGTVWINKLSGELFVCVDNTQNANKWIGNQSTIIAPPTYNPVDMFEDNSIIAFYRFNNSTNDESGLFHGKKIGDVNYTVGIFDYAIDFGKVPNNKNAFIVKNIELSDSMNFSFWVYKYYNNQDNPYISLSYKDIYNAILLFEFGGKIRIILDNKLYTFGKSAYIPTNEWVLVSLNIDNKQRIAELFLDGEFVDKVTFSDKLMLSNFSYDNCLVFGQDQDVYCGGFDVTQSFLGKLDHLRIFRRVLLSKEVKKLYEEKNNDI